MFKEKLNVTYPTHLLGNKMQGVRSCNHDPFRVRATHDCIYGRSVLLHDLALDTILPWGVRMSPRFLYISLQPVQVTRMGQMPGPSPIPSPTTRRCVWDRSTSTEPPWAPYAPWQHLAVRGWAHSNPLIIKLSTNFFVSPTLYKRGDPCSDPKPGG